MVHFQAEVFVDFVVALYIKMPALCIDALIFKTNMTHIEHLFRVRIARFNDDVYGAERTRRCG